MSDSISYDAKMTRYAEQAMAKGHRHPESLRDLLICTTCTTTSEMVGRYFVQHHEDENLLGDLIAIALEGEDAGDTPWAAANVLSAFPVALLKKHREQLLELSKHDWNYLNVPAKAALDRLQQEP